MYVYSWAVTVTGLDGLRDHPSSDAVADSQELHPQQQHASTGSKGTGRRAKMAQATSSFIDLGSTSSSSSTGGVATSTSTAWAVRVRGVKTKAVDYNDRNDDEADEAVSNKTSKRAKR